MAEYGLQVGSPSRRPRWESRQSDSLRGVSRLANLSSPCVLALQRDESGERHLRSLKTASL